MAWIDVDYLENAIGEDQVYALGLADIAHAATARLTQYELEARGTVISTMTYAGYTPPGEFLVEVTNEEKITGAFLKKLTAAILLRDTFALIPGIQLSDQANSALSVGLSLLDEVYNKRIPIPGMTVNTADGYGGNQFNTTGYLPPPTSPVFRRLRGSTF